MNFFPSREQEPERLDAAALSELRELEPDRVCIIKPSSLGDVVHAFPVLAALRQRWPRARIDWVINRGLRDLVERHPLIDRAILFDRGRMKASGQGFGHLKQFLGELSRDRFDVVIDLQGLLRSGLMTAATRAPIRVGLSDAREGSKLFYTHRVSVQPRVSAGAQVHIVDRLLKVAEAFGAASASASAPARFPLAIDESDRAWAQSRLDGSPRPLVVYNVGARWVTKRWPPGRFADVARRIKERRGGTAIAVGAPEDREWVSQFLGALNDPDAIDLCGRTSLRELAAVAESCDVFVSNDTGPLHLAAAAGTRTVGIYTCTNPARTGPYGPRAVTVSTRIWCAASLLKTCGRMECMSELTPDRVETAVDAALGTSPISDPALR